MMTKNLFHISPVPTMGRGAGPCSPGGLRADDGPRASADPAGTCGEAKPGGRAGGGGRRHRRGSGHLGGLRRLGCRDRCANVPVVAGGRRALGGSVEPANFRRGERQSLGDKPGRHTVREGREPDRSDRALLPRRDAACNHARRSRSTRAPDRGTGPGSRDRPLPPAVPETCDRWSDGGGPSRDGAREHRSASVRPGDG
jgi:hypothetical protein